MAVDPFEIKDEAPTRWQRKQVISLCIVYSYIVSCFKFLTKSWKFKLTEVCIDR